MLSRPHRTSSPPRRSFLAALVLLLLLAEAASAQTVQWIRQFGSSDVDIAYGVAVNSSGVYVVGYTIATLPGQTSAGSTDAFIRKYDSSGNVVWTRQFGTQGFDQAFAVAVDSTGVYVAGLTNGSLPRPEQRRRHRRLPAQVRHRRQRRMDAPVRQQRK